MIFALATNNPKKLKEIQRILGALGHSGKSLDQLGISINILEDGTSFSENAVIKARTIARMCKLPTISDDSGLEVDFLHGQPGIYTARYAGNHPTDDENIDKLLNALKGVEKEKRTARFVSCVCLYIPSYENIDQESRFIVCRGECEGWIGFEREGEDGFGYDPIFMVGDKSYAQMPADEKDLISHRGIAMRKLEKEMQKLKF
ncbi:MAG: RdgB/HAM1 family non-canonical purine NTP pyrophosphatase [Oscillospiraceae bacterium]